MMYGVWLMVALAAWVVTSVVTALVVGVLLRGARLAAATAGAPVTRSAATAAGTRDPERRPGIPTRRWIPVPGFAVALGLVGVGLQGVGLLVAVAGLDEGTLAVLSMDAPRSLPRLYVAVLLAAAALAAFVGATRLPHRRVWWVAVGLVVALTATVKAGGTLHSGAVDALGLAERPWSSLALGAVVAGSVIAALFWLSRGDRRDRRRVLGSLALLAVASVGLSSVSSALGATAAADVATFVEECGEALAAVAVLVSVLAGTAPRLVLPDDWPLRRLADVDPDDLGGWPSDLVVEPSERRGRDEPFS